MKYYGDYAFDEYLKQGAKDFDELVRFLAAHRLIAGNLRYWKEEACTCFMAKNNRSEIVFGRNMDTAGAHPVLFLQTHPSKGYASTSFLKLNYVKGNTGDPQKDNEAIWANILAAPYFPADGINERGVAVAVLTVPEWRPKVEPNKVTLYRLTVNRLILDYAENVDEAIALVQKYNVNDNKGDGLHYFVADATGNSAVIEFNDGKWKS
jgi:penicillin V acylase-like amidase (Ntn superfamily)